MSTRLCTALFISIGALAACSDEPSDDAPSGDSRSPASGETKADKDDPLYLVGSSVQSGESSSFLYWTTPELDGAELALDQAELVSGGGGAFTFGGAVYVSDTEKLTITRHTLEGDTLKPGKTVSFANRGFMWMAYDDTVLNEERAFLVNDAQLQIVEWNPTTMTITDTHDIGALEREGWKHEYRGGFVRPSDGKFFFYWTYTNDRTEFLNDFVLGVFDSKDNSVSVQTDSECPASAGFGGFFDEQGDLYLIADSFGLFTQFKYAEPKDACILRVKKGETQIDSEFTLRPSQAMGGRQPWGLYYLGKGLAFTSGADPAQFENFNALFELLFAPVHNGWLLDLHTGEAREITDLPLDGVGFESHSVDGRLLVPRTTGKVEFQDIMSTQSTLFDIQPDGSAREVLSLPGYIAPVARVR